MKLARQRCLTGLSVSAFWMLCPKWRKPNCRFLTCFCLLTHVSCDNAAENARRWRRWRKTFEMWRKTYVMWRKTYEMWRKTYNVREYKRYFVLGVVDDVSRPRLIFFPCKNYSYRHLTCYTPSLMFSSSVFSLLFAFICVFIPTS